MNADLFKSDPRSFALEMVENQIVSADHLLLCALKYMSHDDVRDMLDSNELSPRFDEDEDEDNEEDNAELEDWIYILDDGEHDIESMRSDIASGNLEIGDDERAKEYEHENIVRASITNGQFIQAKEQCDKYGLDFYAIRSEMNANEGL